jgi:hypothetical protein
MVDLRFTSPAEGADLAAFLGRVVRLDAAALVRLRGGPGALTGYVSLPFGVMVSRSAHTREAPPDVTVGAAALLATLDATGGDSVVRLPDSQDAAWRGQLPPAAGWERLDTVPAAVVTRLVRAGVEALRSAGPGGVAGRGGEALLDHEALTVSGAGRTVALPLRVLSAAWRMGFLGDEGAGSADDPDRPERLVGVSTSGRWARLAAPYGSAYHQVTPALLVGVR